MDHMNKNLPPLNWLKTFEVAARLLNFSAAGRELNMTQSAVSQQIRLLEHYLDDPLFKRQNRKVSLTNSGLAFLPVVQDAIERLQRGTADIFSPVGKGELVLEVNTAFAMIWLGPRLNSFCSRYPGLSLQIADTNWESEFNAVPSDLSIIHGKGDWPGVTAYPLFKPRLKPYCSKRLAKQLSDPVDLLSQPLIEVTGNRQGWLDWFEQSGVSGTESILRHKVDSVAMAVSMSEYGLGAFLSYEGFVSGSDVKYDLMAPFELSMDTDDNYFLVHPEGRPLSKSAAVFCEWLFEEIDLKITD
ncbi:MAG: LysR family transcriptional regulator [Amphritea sp.]